MFSKVFFNKISQLEIFLINIKNYIKYLYFLINLKKKNFEKEKTKKTHLIKKIIYNFKNLNKVLKVNFL